MFFQSRRSFLQSGWEKPALVDSPQIASASLLNPLPPLLRLYNWPFLAAYPAFFSVYLRQAGYDEYIQSQEWTVLYFGAILTVQALVWLGCHWSVGWRAMATGTKATRVEDAKQIKIIPIANAGSADICDLVHDKSGDKEEISFLFQKRRFIYNSETGSFSPLVYPLDSKPKLEHFQLSQGLRSAKEIDHLQHHYGDNTFDIPVPTFTELFKEHAVAPFFVFQVFCVGLWCLDEYWYYSIFTLVMLVIFESTVVWQRQRTLNEFRGMRHQAVQHLGLPYRKVIEIQTMLSGESTPLLKESIALRPKVPPIEIEGLDKNSLLYGGTKVLQITHNAANPDEVAVASKNGVPPPPDNGGLAVVTRTGFETSQGSLGVLMDRKRSKLLLDCLPMELSLAHAIFCTEPFRIPFAGRVDICCFDKTGTLTGEDLVVEGIAGVNGSKADMKTLKKVEDSEIHTTLVLATAHALVKLDEGEIRMARVQGRGFGIPAGMVQIRRRFQFSSALKRQSAVATVALPGEKKFTFAGVKGAPETIRKMLTHVPENYEETFKYYTRKGSRVLALAYKNMSEGGENDDAKKAVRMLNESSHRVVMITGDNPLTAVHVAREVEIVDRDVLILDAPEEEDSKHELVWRNFQDKAHVVELLKHTWVYARFLPSRRFEFILTVLKDAGYTTLMCGDGTNDVGALKQAHVGVALLNAGSPPHLCISPTCTLPGPETLTSRKLYEREATKKGTSVEAYLSRNIPKEKTASNIIATAAVPNQSAQQQQIANGSAALADNLMGSMMDLDENEPPTIKLGDASVAAPFTTTIQMYKILALKLSDLGLLSFPCSTSTVSSFGDGQVTISGMLMSVLLPDVEKLSKERPQPNIFNSYIIGSFHIVSLIYISRYVAVLEPKNPDVDLEGEFSPSLLNSAIYLLQLIQQISTFAINYQGRPFRESLKENKGMYYGSSVWPASRSAARWSLVPELNEKLRLVPFTDAFKFTLTMTMILDYVACYAIEYGLKSLRPDQDERERIRCEKDKIMEEEKA
ncbi:cation transporting ATPase [Sphaerosporella brunnea]|uniref:Cation transporting ATPase n=1 Tax=Sphaerosporella brunnea TaxID=1250544 RepID=A0A5J5EHU7_9PEZI|nr:cation transporting ATPase [Sphaerosporella brunnea]